jgi:hypothetical protein
MVRWTALSGCVAVLLGLSGCGPLVLSVDDAVATSAGPVRLAAYLGREHVFGLRSEIEHGTVTFFVNGRQVGENTVDDEGRAVVTAADLAGEPRAFLARARAGGKVLEASGRIFYWPANRVGLAVDIDHTISQTDYRRLIVKERVAVSPPIPGARETLNELADKYNILYLTGRPRFLIEKTRGWLEHYSFPPGPVMAAPRFRDALLQLRFKQRTLHGLREQWPDLLIGIGNRTSDIEAYASNQMLPVIVYSGGEEKHYSDAVVLQDWQFVRRFFEANARVLTNPRDLEKVIQGQVMIEQPLIPYEAAKSHYEPKPFERGD